jgi:dolichol-phosphate mannosyltransferase
MNGAPRRRLLSVVVPLLNEAENLEAVHARLAEVAATLSCDVEMVFVDDGSSDGSFAKLNELRARDGRVCPIRLARNFGSHGACLAGFARARGDWAVIVAADLQDPPELIQQLVAQAEAGHDVVWARRERRDDPASTLFFAGLYNRMMRRIALPNWPERGFDFVLVSRRVLDELLSRRESNTSLFGQILWLGFPQTSVAYERVARRAGRSKWTLGKKLKLAIDSFVGFSYVPIRVISLVGLFLAIAGAIYAGFIAVRRLYSGIPVEGWASLMVVVLVLGGVQLLMLGVLGEYLWRTLDQTRGRPPFVVAEAIGFEESAWQGSRQDSQDSQDSQGSKTGASSSPAAPGSSAAT